MLTIKEPLKLSTKPSVISFDDTFGKRLEANYHVIAGSLTPENMLHLITQKQDILMEGDQMTSIVSVDNRINRQQINMELINNVMNRILVSDEQKLSYQDRVFIDNVLNKIGITDVKYFMNQVSFLKQNTTNINKLLKLYNSEDIAIDELKQYFRQNNIDNSRAVDNSKSDEHHTNVQLHQEILSRLQAGDIYEELENYFRNTQNDNHYIDEREFYVSEQLLQARNIELNNVRNDIANTENALEYRAINSYELGAADEYTTNEGDVRNEYIEAVILNAVNNAYTLRNSEITNKNHVWYELLQSLRQTAENTLNRFEYMHEHNNISSENIEHYHELTQTRLENEIKSLQELHQEYKDNISQTYIQNINNVTDNSIQLLHQMNDAAQNVYNSRTDSIEEIQNNISSAVSVLTELNRQYSKVHNEISGQLDIEGDSTVVYSESNEQNEYTKQENSQTDISTQNNINTAINRVSQLRNSFSDNIKNISEKLEENIKNVILVHTDNKQINNSTINNMLEEYRDNVTMLITNELKKLSETDSTYLTEHKSEITDSDTQINNIKEENRHLSQQINYLTSEEQQLKQQLNSIEQTNINNIRQDANVIDRTRPAGAIQINRSRAMAEARKVLEAPDEVKLEYMNIHNELENSKQQINVTENKIDANVQKIFEQIAEYQKNPSAPHPNISTSQAALDRLMMDTSRPAAPREKLIEKNIVEKTQNLIHDVRQQEIREQLDRIINVETPEIAYIRQPQNIELLHKAVETGINEEVLEELKNVNRNVNRSTQIHTDDVTESENITRTVTNHVNNVELRNNTELTQIIAENVQGQLNNLTDKVYRKLEKRMDSEKRRRGL